VPGAARHGSIKSKICSNPPGEQFPFQSTYHQATNEVASRSSGSNVRHYQKLPLGIVDQLTVDRIKSLIAELRTQKETLHPEQKQ
jgi:hypothetical protein